MRNRRRRCEREASVPGKLPIIDVNPFVVRTLTGNKATIIAAVHDDISPTDWAFDVHRHVCSQRFDVLLGEDPPRCHRKRRGCAVRPGVRQVKLPGLVILDGGRVGGDSIVGKRSCCRPVLNGGQPDLLITLRFAIALLVCGTALFVPIATTAGLVAILVIRSIRRCVVAMRGPGGP